MEQAWSAIEVKLKQRGLSGGQSAGHSAARCHREGTCSGRDREARAVTTAIVCTQCTLCLRKKRGVEFEVRHHVFSETHCI